MKNSESVDLNFNQYLSVAKRRWVPALSILAGTVALGIIASALIKPSYQAEGRLLFKNSSFKVLGANLIPSTLDGGDSGDLKPLVSTQNPIVTQVELMTSRPLLQQTIDRLQLKDSNGKAVDPEDLKLKLTTKIVGGADVVQIGYKSRDAKEAARVVNMLMDVYLDNDVRVNASEAESTGKIMAAQLPKTQSDLTAAEATLRQFKQKHNVVDLGEESKSAVGIIGNLQTNINATQAQLDEIDAQSKALQQKIGLNTQEAIVMSAIGQSKEIQATLAQLQDAERLLATESGRFSDNNPIVINLKEKQVNLKTLLERQIRSTVGKDAQIPQNLLQIGDLKQNLIKDFLQFENQRMGVKKKLASLQTSKAAYEKRVGAIPKLVQEQRQLERQVDVTQSTYQNLLKKIQELQLAKNRTTSNARIISSAIVAEKPDPLPKLLPIGLSAILGTFFATGAIAYLEIKDKSLKTIKQIQAAYGYPLVGAIPAGDKPLDRQRSKPSQPEHTTLEVSVRDTPQSLTSEMSRTIQANIRFLHCDRPLKCVAVTSAVANEGKSKVAANVAAAIAATGQKVLLIDADLRVPSQHRLWKLPLKSGLSDLLSNKTKLERIVWTVMPDLDVLTAGARPADPLSSLDSERMRALLQAAGERYDIIVIDTPPLLVAQDAPIVGRMTDGLLLVSRPGVIDADNARMAKEQLTISGCRVFGTIVNGVIRKYESEDIFAANQDYFSDERETELPWNDYMTQLGESITALSQQETTILRNDPERT